MKNVHSISDLIASLGGCSQLAKWAGYEDARGVHNWIARGIPPSYHLRLLLEARRKRIQIDPAVFRLPEADAESLRMILYHRDSRQMST